MSCPHYRQNPNDYCFSTVRRVEGDGHEVAYRKCTKCGENWDGWALGIYPPYWGDIRDYIFERDNYTCQKCGERKSKSNLRAHHIKPKEEYGTDSARNLMTLCAVCHPDEHPIYPDDEKETLEVLGKSIPEGEVAGLAL